MTRPLHSSWGYLRLVKVVCETCGKTFLVKNCRLGTAKYCSRSCRSRRAPVVCATCGKIFYVKQSAAKNRAHCSRECMANAYNKHREVTCIVCGTTFLVPRSRSVALFCSKKCMGIYWRGPNHPMWVDGRDKDREFQRRYRREIYLRSAKVRNTKKEHARRRKLLKKAVPGSHTRDEWIALLERYGWRCAYCGEKMTETPGPLQATRDHVVPITCGGTDDISNIVPACMRCNARKGNKIMLNSAV